MTRGRFYSSVMPIAGILYALAIIVLPHPGTVAIVGAFCFALIAVCGTLFVGR
jgi:H+/gluconate symporter-like permease